MPVCVCVVCKKKKSFFFKPNVAPRLGRRRRDLSEQMLDKGKFAFMIMILKHFKHLFTKRTSFAFFFYSTFNRDLIISRKRSKSQAMSV